MEHLYITKQSTHIAVPLTCSSIYDGEGLRTYPERYAKVHGWDRNKDIDLGTEKYGDLAPEEIEKFLQSWLYFGTIAEFFSAGEVKTAVDLCIFTDQQQSLVTTKELRRYLVRWINRVVRRREEWDKEWKVKIREEHKRMKNVLGKEPIPANLALTDSDASKLTDLADQTEEKRAVREQNASSLRELTTEEINDPIPNPRTLARNLGKPGEHEREDWIKAEESLKLLYSYLERYCVKAEERGSGVLRGEASNATKQNPNWPVRDEITMAMIALGWYLQEAATYACGISPSCEAYGKKWFISPLLTKRLLEDGHCRMDVTRLSQFVQVDGLYYAATNPTIRPHGTRIHGRCNEWECTVPGIDEKLYIWRHVMGCGVACGEFVGPKVADLVEIIQSGKTPVLRWTIPQGGIKPALLVGHTELWDGKYVAISHVWSDGMGNPHANTLPRCVIEDIQRKVDKLYEKEEGSTWFWLDTLCIPVQKENYRYRVMSIERMRNIYAAANMVLVLDSWISGLPDTAEGPEIVPRLFFCEWTHRLWTLQEGVLANAVSYQLDGRTMSSRELRESCAGLENSLAKKAYFTRFPMAVQHNVDDLFQSSGFLGRLMKDYSEDADGFTVTDAFGWIKHFWSYRRTSHRSDETVCMATLLKIDPQELLHIRGGGSDETADLRQEWFLNRLHRFCKQLIFHRSERGVKDGLRWAPRSFLKGRPLDFIRAPEMEGEEDVGNATYTGGVLTVNYPGLRYKGTGVELTAGGGIILQPEGKSCWCRLTLIEKREGMEVLNNPSGSSFGVIIRAFGIKGDVLSLVVGQRFEALVGVTIGSGSDNATRLRPESVALLDVIDCENQVTGEMTSCIEIPPDHTWSLL